MERVENLVLDAERALYGLNGAEVFRCTFDGPADGESALKECRDVHLDDCDQRLRYHSGTSAAAVCAIAA